jgi:hypothetical protein
MFTQIKLIIGSISAIAVGIFYALFVSRGKKIDELTDENRELQRHKEVNNAITAVDVEVYEQYKYQEDQIEEAYDEEIQELYKEPDALLSPSFLDKLRKFQGLQNNSDSSPE